MIGKRIYDYAGVGIPKAGEYGIDSRTGEWFAMCPDGLSFANLRMHEVIEHDDGTITVSPSISCTIRNVCDWHGYLKAGVWSLA